MEYQHEAYEMFTRMVLSVREEVVDLIFKIQAVRTERRPRILEPTQFLHPEAPRTVERSAELKQNGPAPFPGEVVPENSHPGRPESAVGSSEPFRREHPKVGRNDPCPCGSGMKFKRCHGS